MTATGTLGPFGAFGQAESANQLSQPDGFLLLENLTKKMKLHHSVALIFVSIIALGGQIHMPSSSIDELHFNTANTEVKVDLVC